MERNDLIKRLMAVFLVELEEHVSALNRDLLALEQAAADADRAEITKVLFRSAHSLKGAARSVDLGEVERICHQMESLFATLKGGESAIEPELMQLLFQATDAIGDAGKRLQAEEDLKGAPIHQAAAALTAYGRGERVAPVDAGQPPAAAAPASAVPAPPAPAAASPDASPAPSPPAPAAPAAPSPAPTVDSPLPAEALPPPQQTRAPGGAVSNNSTVPGSRLADSAATVKVPAARLDDLLAMGDELLIARNHLAGTVGDLDPLAAALAEWSAEWGHVDRLLRKLELEGTGRHALEVLARRSVLPVLGRARDRLDRMHRQVDEARERRTQDLRQLNQVALPLEEGIRGVRMYPFGTACQGLERAVRDLARHLRKEVRLEIVGGDIELDRSVLEGLKDPLLHLVRNAIDHGIETAPVRQAAGKPAEARLRVQATLRGSQVEVMIEDDGQGLDLDAIARAARRKGHDPGTEPDEIARSIFLPDFSTREQVTEVSGRGVGLDVVTSRLDELRGAVSVSTEAGKGTRFTMSVPLTLSTIPGLLVRAAGRSYVVPTGNVRRLLRLAPTEIRRVEEQELIAYEERSVAVVALADLLELEDDESRERETLAVLVLSWGDRQAALMVDELLGEETVVVKSLGERLRGVKVVSGGALLGSGELVLILNPAELVAAALSRTNRRELGKTADEASGPERRRILVADDSMTTRTMEKTILEVAGYEVLVASDGQEAWEMLQHEPVELLISDVEMPRLTGIELTERVRGDRRLQRLPIILLTGLDSPQDIERGSAAGADAYLVKSAFDQRELLATISRHL